MRTTSSQNSKLPFRCHMVCVSLVVGTLLLFLIILLYRLEYISPPVALWSAAIVFVSAAIYETFLLYLLTRDMLNRVNKTPGR